MELLYDVHVFLSTYYVIINYIFDDWQGGAKN